MSSDNFAVFRDAVSAMDPEGTNVYNTVMRIFAKLLREDEIECAGILCFTGMRHFQVILDTSSQENLCCMTS